MRLLASFALLAALAGAADLPYFSVLSEDAGAWPEILGSIGLQRQPAGVSKIFVARTGASASVEWPTRVEHGAILILEGESSLADMFGFRRAPDDPVRVQSLTDVHRPALSIVWEKGLELPVLECRKMRRYSPANAGPARPSSPASNVAQAPYFGWPRRPESAATSAFPIC